MVMVPAVSLRILLDGREVLLRSREISGLQILREVLKSLGNRTVVLRRTRRRRILLQGGKVGLGRGKVPGRQVLA